jgi:Uma2 family endonuclease
MLVEKKHISLSDFEAFTSRPENQDKQFEFIYGEIVEVVSNPISSKIAAKISGYIFIYLLQHKLGHLTGADGGYVINLTERYIPDVGFIFYEKQLKLVYEDGYIPNPPDLAVEVVSPSNKDKELMVKIGHYLEVGTLVWVVYPKEKQVAVYEQGKAVRVLKEDESLSGEKVLPDFVLKVRDIFED